jgi:hypothetical protein
MIPGKIYKATGPINLIKDMYFPFNNNNIENIDYNHLLTLDKNSKPNVFLFMKHCYDSNRTIYALILYKNTYYIMQNEYHNGNNIKSL